MINTKNSTFAKVVATPATRPKPKAPAIIAINRNARLHPSIVFIIQ